MILAHLFCYIWQYKELSARFFPFLLPSFFAFLDGNTFKRNTIWGVALGLCESQMEGARIK